MTGSCDLYHALLKMAAFSYNTGHQCQFVGLVNEEFKCKKCSLVARDLSIAVCCGQHYCQVCISPFQEGSKPCPGCGQEGFTVVPHVRYRKSILALEVRCLMKDHDCGWTGVLQDLDAHLGNCHSTPCPNGCAVHPIKYNTLKAHLKECSNQEIECEVVGCGEKVKRKDMETHIKQNTRHFFLMAATQRKSIKSHEELCREIEDLKKRLKTLEDRLSSYPVIPPVYITLQKFEEKKAANKCWESPNFYTHLGGYKLSLKIWPNGYRYPGKTTPPNAISIKLCSKKGENDEVLRWPTRFSIALELLNQCCDKNHYKVKQCFKWDQPPKDTCEVDWFTGPYMKPALTKFIQHSALSPDIEGEKEYKKNDCLHFRVTDIIA